MKKIAFGVSLIVLILSCNVYALEEVSQRLKDREHSIRDIIDKVAAPLEKEISVVEKTKHMFKEGKVSGQIKVLHSGYYVDGTENQYATAVGGQLKYELAEYNGFNAAVEFSTAHDIGFATGEENRHNGEISSQDGSYTELSQAYINYTNGKLNFRAGRQLIDTPLADSDDIRIISNTFEAYTLSYEDEEVSFFGGLLTKWQGTDAGLSPKNHWSDTGEDGTFFGGLSYADKFIDTSVWYYDISKDNDPNSATLNVANTSLYIDFSLHIAFSKDYALHASTQYVDQRESDNSGIESSIYGAMVEFIVFEDLALSSAYNWSEKQALRGSFSGFGGGALYTNMDSMIIDVITLDRDAQAVVAGLTYTHDDFGLMYAYGDFKGRENSLGGKEHIVEQNIGFEYMPNKNLTIGALYVLNEDNKNSGSNGGDWENIRVLLLYKF